MTFSISRVYDMHHSIEESLLAPRELVRLETEPIFNGKGSIVTYHVDPQTELYLLCESDFYNASFAYALYGYDWDKREWNEICSDIAGDDWESIVAVRNHMGEAITELYNRGFELIGD